MKKVLERHDDAQEVIWCQEEPQNRGSWNYIFPLLLEIYRDRPVAYVGRQASASTATGSLKIHREEQQQLVEEAITGTIQMKKWSSQR